MPELAAEAPEEEQVRGWRFDCFLEAGFTVREAERLSAGGADHHAAEDLLNAGCTPRLAYRILRPLPREEKP